MSIVLRAGGDHPSRVEDTAVTFVHDPTSSHGASLLTFRPRLRDLLRLGSRGKSGQPWPGSLERASGGDYEILALSPIAASVPGKGGVGNGIGSWLSPEGAARFKLTLPWHHKVARGYDACHAVRKSFGGSIECSVNINESRRILAPLRILMAVCSVVFGKCARTMYLRKRVLPRQGGEIHIPRAGRRRRDSIPGRTILTDRRDAFVALVTRDIPHVFEGKFAASSARFWLRSAQRRCSGFGRWIVNSQIANAAATQGGLPDEEHELVAGSPMHPDTHVQDRRMEKLKEDPATRPGERT